MSSLWLRGTFCFPPDCNEIISENDCSRRFGRPGRLTRSHPAPTRIEMSCAADAAGIPVYYLLQSKNKSKKENTENTENVENTRLVTAVRTHTAGSPVYCLSQSHGQALSAPARHNQRD